MKGLAQTPRLAAGGTDEGVRAKATSLTQYESNVGRCLSEATPRRSRATLSARSACSCAQWFWTQR